MEFGVSITKKGIAYPWIGGGTGQPLCHLGAEACTIRGMAYLEFLNKVSINKVLRDSLVLYSVSGRSVWIMHKSSRVWARDSSVDLMLKFLFQVPRRLTAEGIPFLLSILWLMRNKPARGQ